MPVHQIGLPADMDAFLALGRRARRRDRRGRRVRDRRDLQGPPDRLARPARLLLAAPAQGHHDRRGRHDHDQRRRARPTGCASCASTRWTSPTSRATTPTDVVFESYPERGWNCRMTDMQAALGPLPARGARRDPRRAHAPGRALQRRARRLPGLETPYEPDYAVRTWQSYAVRVTAGSPLDRTELMRRLLHDGVATRRGVMAIHHEARLRRRATCCCPHTEAAARDVLHAAAVPGPHRRRRRTT